jgi:phosphate transport system permease protein
MQFLTLVLALLLISAMVYRLGARQAMRLGGGTKGALHSLPSYYGYYVALWCGVPALILAAGWMIFSPMILKSVVMDSLPPDTLSLPAARLSLLMNEVKQMASSGDYRYASDDVARSAAERYHSLRLISFAAMTVAVLSAALLGTWWGLRRVSPRLRARNAVEGMVTLFLIISSTVAIFTTIGIVLSLLFESLRFFAQVPITDFLFGLHWSPQTAIRSDQVGSSGAFGAVPLFTGTLLISVIAMIVAVPVGLLSAIYMAEYAHPKFRAVAKPLLEILAGIPTVVYGFFAVLTVAPALRGLGAVVGLNISADDHSPDLFPV